MLDEFSYVSELVSPQGAIAALGELARVLNLQYRALPRKRCCFARDKYHWRWCC